MTDIAPTLAQAAAALSAAKAATEIALVLLATTPEVVQPRPPVRRAQVVEVMRSRARP